jgi:hypothetical protein
MKLRATSGFSFISLSLLVAYVVEEVLVGLFHGVALIMCTALVPFFAFREMTRAIGRPQFDALWT